MTIYKTRGKTGVAAFQFARPADPAGLPAGTFLIYFYKNSGQLHDTNWVVEPEVRGDAEVIMTDADFNAKFEIDTP